MPLWLAARPLVLASRSTSRRALLEAAGVPVEIHPADIEERAIEAGAGLSGPSEVAALLARAKARAVAAAMPGRLVLGADQTLALETRRFSKPTDRAAAAEQLRALRGRTHALHSALALARGGDIVFEYVAVARLTMRPFTEAFLQSYLDAAGAAVTGSVGAYQLEGIGVQLFERVDGDQPTILGLPLLPLLDWLRGERLLEA
jgi:nucleoside triphosphate pyrophosphatase